MLNLDWERISPENFETLCIDLLYREGYRDIVPLGSRGVKEEGRDAIEETFSGAGEGNRVVVFQFKRWTRNYTDTQIKRMVKKELDEKIVPSRRNIDEYIHVTCHPLVRLKNWFIDSLSKDYHFTIRFFEKSWFENRLNHESQDLRREFFGIGIERHSPQSLLNTCRKQILKTIGSLGTRYIPELYVNRSIEIEFSQFLDSDKKCFLLVDRSGRGKTNLLCYLADNLSETMPVIFILGTRQLASENSLAKHIVDELGYTSPQGTRWQLGIEDLEKVSECGGFLSLIFIDGISETNDIVLMKKALRELLINYGDLNYVKFCFTCRDTLWHRFLIDIPEQYIYQTKQQKSIIKSSNTFHQYGIILGDWSGPEFEKASSLYSNYFNVHFKMSEEAAEHCKYPLLFRLFCETYSGKYIGLVNSLPIKNVFDEYIKSKSHKIIDYFGIEYSDQFILSMLEKITEIMWLNNNCEDIDRDRLESILLNALPNTSSAFLTRLYDEGLLIQIENRTKFAFDELKDYLQYIYLSHKILEICPLEKEHIRKLCDKLNDDISENSRLIIQKFLILYSRNNDDPAIISDLLNITLQIDLYLFAQCAWQRLLINDALNNDNLEIGRLFGEKLSHYYAGIINNYFSRIKFGFYPFSKVRSKTIGIDIYCSPGFREICYSYRWKENDDKVNLISVDTFPVWGLQLTDENGNDILRHNPEKGVIISSLRSPEEVWHIIDFEWNSPFPGVSMSAPDRIALTDVWNEIVNSLDNHQFIEPRLLLQERARTLSEKLPSELASITNPDQFLLESKKAIDLLAKNARSQVELRMIADEFHFYLLALKMDSFEGLLPPPNMNTEQSFGKQIWNYYSDNQLIEYIQKFFNYFNYLYPSVVKFNFLEISQWLNLYKQWPVSFIILINSSKEYIRIFALPEKQLDNVLINVIQIPSDIPQDLSLGKLNFDNIPFNEAVFTNLTEYERKSIITSPIDIILPITHLFIENPLNSFVNNWFKSELSQIFNIPYRWFY